MNRPVDPRAIGASAPYVPPRPRSLGPLAALLRAAWRRDGNLIGLLPKQVYERMAMTIGWSRRGIVILNDPSVVRSILTDPTDIYPKNDLMTGALAPLVGDSVFVSSGERWRKQRAMIAPAFTHMRLASAFGAMQAALDEACATLDAAAQDGRALSLDFEMSRLTADIICRTVFSTSLASGTARDVFTAFAAFERSVANVEIRRLIFDRPFKAIRQQHDVLAACETIRRHLGALIDSHAKAGFRDIAADIVDARDAHGNGFSRAELIDQLGVFFLAGHETTASALTWALTILAIRPDVRERLRAEVDAVARGGPLTLDHIRHLPFATAIFRETLRLYPPITFIPRVAAQDAEAGDRVLKRGTMVMIAPWVIHRHKALWREPDRFDPDRFMPERAHELVEGAYLPFGLGPRVCVGANFATIEATLILAELVRRYDMAVTEPRGIEPVARLTTRPREEIALTLSRRNVG